MSHARRFENRDPSIDIESQRILFRETLRLTACAGSHPLDLAKTLIQLGHEPFAPVQTKTFLTRKPALKLPNLFVYLGHIRKRDGFFGLYRGLSYRLVGVAVNSAANIKFEEYWPIPDFEEEDPEKEDSEKKALNILLHDIRRECYLRISCILVTQPFHVLAVRCMAQFIGRETGKYEGFFSAIHEVLKENGVLGFWQGTIPRTIGELCTVSLTHILTFIVNRYIFEDPTFKNYTHHGAALFANSLFYPFQVVSNCIIVSKSGLAAGLPPRMPLYRDWIDCMRQLRLEGQEKRGNSLISRYYTGPQVIVGNQVVPLNASMRS